MLGINLKVTFKQVLFGQQCAKKDYAIQNQVNKTLSYKSYKGNQGNIYGLCSGFTDMARPFNRYTGFVTDRNKDCDS